MIHGRKEGAVGNEDGLVLGSYFLEGGGAISILLMGVDNCGKVFDNLIVELTILSI